MATSGLIGAGVGVGVVFGLCCYHYLETLIWRSRYLTMLFRIRVDRGYWAISAFDGFFNIVWIKQY